MMVSRQPTTCSSPETPKISDHSCAPSPPLSALRSAPSLEATEFETRTARPVPAAHTVVLDSSQHERALVTPNGSSELQALPSKCTITLVPLRSLPTPMANTLLLESPHSPK